MVSSQMSPLTGDIKIDEIYIGGLSPGKCVRVAEDSSPSAMRER